MYDRDVYETYEPPPQSFSPASVSQFSPAPVSQFSPAPVSQFTPAPVTQFSRAGRHAETYTFHELQSRPVHMVVLLIAGLVCILLGVIGLACFILQNNVQEVPKTFVEWLQGTPDGNFTQAEGDEVLEFTIEFMNTLFAYKLNLGLLVIGLASLVLAFLAFNAVFWKNTNFRYAIAAVLVAIAFLLVFVTTKESSLIEYIRRELKKSLENYDGFNGNHTASKIWDRIHVKLQCCGVDGYKDFHGLQFWPPANATSLLTPFSCCKEFQFHNISNMTCALKGSANERNNWLNYGCITHVEEAAGMAFKFPILFVPFLVILSAGLVVLVLQDTREIQ